MATITVYDTAGEKVSKLKLNDEIFKVEVKEHLLHAVVQYPSDAIAPEVAYWHSKTACW